MDDGTRSLPSEWQEGGIQSQEFIDATRSGGGRTDASRDAAAEELIRLTKAFEPVMRPSENTSDWITVSTCRSEILKSGCRDLGFLFGLNYDRDYSFYGNGITGRHMVSDAGVDTDLYLQDTRGIEEVSWGNLATLAYKSPTITPLVSISFSIIAVRTKPASSKDSYSLLRTVISIPACCIIPSENCAPCNSREIIVFQNCST